MGHKQHGVLRIHGEKEGYVLTTKNQALASIKCPKIKKTSKEISKRSKPYVRFF